MAGRSLFGRGGDDDADAPASAPPTSDATEGVRVLDPGEAEKAAERADAARRRGGDTPRYGDRPPGPPPGPRPAMRFPLADSESPADLPRPKAVSVPDRPPAGRTQPVISVGPPTGEVDLPHWTEPATGEVPKVIIGGAVDDDDERWAAFAQGPRWRDSHEGWDEGTDLVGDLTHPDDEALGALDTSDRISHEDYLTFEDLDVPTAGPPRAGRGSVDDPIHIGSSDAGRAVANPTEPGSGTRPGPRSGARPGRAGQPRASVPPGGPAGRRPTPGAPSRGGPPAPTPPAGGGRNVPQAAAVGLAIFVAALALFALGPGWAMLIVEPVIVACGVEYFNALRNRGDNPPTLLGLVAVAALPWAAFARGEGAVPMVLFLLVFFGVLWYLLGAGGSDPLANLGATVLAVVHVGVFGAFAALLLRVGPVGGATDEAQGVSLLLLAVMGAVAYDVGGFFLGRQFGHTPLSAVSPNKTREGLLAGMASAVLVVLIMRFFPLFELADSLSVGWALVLAVVCALAAPVGDLAESLVKRELGIKDMGTLLPGHGGVLDRFDAVLFVLPSAYYVVRLAFAA